MRNELVEHFAVAKKLGHVDQQILVHGPCLGLMLCEVCGVVIKRRELELREPAREAALDRRPLVAREVDAAGLA